jgi:hypothetical protein
LSRYTTDDLQRIECQLSDCGRETGSTSFAASFVSEIANKSRSPVIRYRSDQSERASSLVISSEAACSILWAASAVSPTRRAQACRMRFIVSDKRSASSLSSSSLWRTVLKRAILDSESQGVSDRSMFRCDSEEEVGRMCRSNDLRDNFSEDFHEFSNTDVRCRHLVAFRSQ